MELLLMIEKMKQMDWNLEISVRVIGLASKSVMKENAIFSVSAR
jgi:hypothetical protein